MSEKVDEGLLSWMLDLVTLVSMHVARALFNSPG